MILHLPEEVNKSQYLAVQLSGSMTTQVFSTLLQWVRLAKPSEQEKDLEILLLRRQLAILQRKVDMPIHVSRAEKLTLVALATRYKSVTGRSVRQLQAVIRIFQPETVFKWHRALVRRKWIYRKKNRGGRLRIEKELEQLIVRSARENSDWGHGKIEGECCKLGYPVCTQTVANVLRRYGIPPASERSSSPSWRHLMSHYKDQILACDFFTVEALFLKTFYVLFSLELGSQTCSLCRLCQASQPDLGHSTSTAGRRYQSANPHTHTNT